MVPARAPQWRKDANISQKNEVLSRTDSAMFYTTRSCVLRLPTKRHSRVGQIVASGGLRGRCTCSRCPAPTSPSLQAKRQASSTWRLKGTHSNRLPDAVLQARDKTAKTTGSSVSRPVMLDRDRLLHGSPEYSGQFGGCPRSLCAEVLA